MSWGVGLGGFLSPPATTCRAQRSRLGSLPPATRSGRVRAIWPPVFNRFSLSAACRSGLRGGRVGAATPSPKQQARRAVAPGLYSRHPSPLGTSSLRWPLVLLMAVPLNVVVAHLEESERLRHPAKGRWREMRGLSPRAHTSSSDPSSSSPSLSSDSLSGSSLRSGSVVAYSSFLMSSSWRP